MKLPRLLLVAVALLLVGAGGLLRTSAASAAPPCWKALLNDWYDGRIDKTYPPQCYRDAIKHLPPDVAVYSNAKDDLNRALQNVLAGKPPNQGLPGGTSTGGGNDDGGGSGGGTDTTASTEPTSTDAGNGPDTIGRDTSTDGVVVSAMKNGSKSAYSVPIPLLVLGGLALLLIAAGAAGVIAKRLQARGPRT
jgi:hypothetical protein